MDEKWLCSLPWTAISNDPNGTVRPCCIYKDTIKNKLGNDYYLQVDTIKEIFHSDYMNNLRQEFLSGIKPKGCQTCITDEANGYKSKRLIYLKNIDYSTVNEYPSEHQLIISNACNLKCRSCTPSHSSTWQAEMKLMTGSTGYSMPFNQVADSESVFWQTRHEWMTYITNLEVVGGEPFYIKKWQQLWNDMIDLGIGKQININFTTNCTLVDFDLLDKLVNNFKHVSISLSIDGIGHIYEYLRFPAQWHEVYDNMKKYYKFYLNNINKVNINICHTIGWLNSYYLDQFHSFIYNEFPKMRIWNNLVHFPHHMALNSMPKDLVPAVMDKLNQFEFENHYNNDIQSIKNLILSSKVLKVDEIIDTFLKHDRIRSQHIIETFPEVFQILQFSK